MRVTLLSSAPHQIIPIIKSTGDQVSTTADPIHANHDADFLVSYNYRHILREPIISLYSRRAINLHISLLPWNRGSDPNFWSWLDGTPKGVTIHFIDKGIDTGPILAQREINLTGETLRSTYQTLQSEMVSLFASTWALIRQGNLPDYPQRRGGSFHKSSDKSQLLGGAALDFDEPIVELTRRLGKFGLTSR